MAAFVLLDDQTVTASVTFADDAGNTVPGPAGVVPTYTVVDPDGTISLVASADGLSAVITATGKLTVTAPAQVNVTAGTLTGSASIQVNASAAASVVVGFGVPAHK